MHSSADRPNVSRTTLSAVQRSHARAVTSCHVGNLRPWTADRLVSTRVRSIALALDLDRAQHPERLLDGVDPQIRSAHTTSQQLSQRRLSARRESSEYVEDCGVHPDDRVAAPVDPEGYLFAAISASNFTASSICFEAFRLLL